MNPKLYYPMNAHDASKLSHDAYQKQQEENRRIKEANKHLKAIDEAIQKAGPNFFIKYSLFDIPDPVRDLVLVTLKDLGYRCQYDHDIKQWEFSWPIDT